MGCFSSFQFTMHRFPTRTATSGFTTQQTENDRPLNEDFWTAIGLKDSRAWFIGLTHFSSMILNSILNHWRDQSRLGEIIENVLPSGSQLVIYRRKNGSFSVSIFDSNPRLRRKIIKADATRENLEQVIASLK